jgi:hypothetical protein
MRWVVVIFLFKKFLLIPEAHRNPRYSGLCKLGLAVVKDLIVSLKQEAIHCTEGPWMDCFYGERC